MKNKLSRRVSNKSQLTPAFSDFIEHIQEYEKLINYMIDSIKCFKF